MAHTPGKQLTDIARECGFSDSSSFSRAFRQQYGCSPRKFDLDAWRSERQAEMRDAHPSHRLDRLPPGANPDGFEVVLRDVPARVFATLRVADPFKPGRVTDAAHQLMGWADARGLGQGEWCGWMWEDPDLVPLEQCRYDVGVVVPEQTHVDEGISLQRFPALRVACLTVRGDIGLEQRALDWLYGTWLPNSRNDPAPFPCFEVWHGRPYAHGTEHFELDLHLPVLA